MLMSGKQNSERTCFKRVLPSQENPDSVWWGFVLEVAGGSVQILKC